MNRITVGDTVNYTGNAEQLVSIYLEDVPVLELQDMQVVNTDLGTYDHSLSVYTDAGYVFPANLLEIV